MTCCINLLGVGWSSQTTSLSGVRSVAEGVSLESSRRFRSKVIDAESSVVRKREVSMVATTIVIA